MRMPALALAALFALPAHAAEETATPAGPTAPPAPSAPAAEPRHTAEAVFAGGCFWCIESDFEKVPGVGDVVSGYSGGTNENPTYENHTKYGHREVVRIPYDPEVVSYRTLVNVFFRSVDPTDGGGQFCDRGHSYSTAIYPLDLEQMKVANDVKQRIEAANLLKEPIATEIAPAKPFTVAEEYHQDYYKKNPLRYKYYRTACRRDSRVREVWGDEAYRGIKEKTS